MKTKLYETIVRCSMMPSGSRVVVGLSGGADSMCLTDMLCSMKDELQITLEAAHVNHGIRGDEADRDAEFVREYCAEKGIALHELNADVPSEAARRKESIELCARNIRYEFFNSLGADVIATAHTGSDRVETMLMNLSRGATLKGLCSIPPVRGNIIRPLIAFTREETERYCHENSVAYVTDSTNLCDEYTRNRYRHNVVSALTEINPSFEKNALRCIESINADNRYLLEIANDRFLRFSDEHGGLFTDALECDECISRRIISLFLEKSGISEFENRHVAFILENYNRGFSLVLPSAVKLTCNKKRLFIDEGTEVFKETEEETVKKGENRVFSGVGSKISLSWCYAPEKASENCFVLDADKISDEIIIRPRRSGDIIHLGKRRCSKPLKKLYSEKKIPVSMRQSLMVIADDKGVVFAEDCGADSTRVSDNKTKNYLIIKTEDVKNE